MTVKVTTPDGAQRFVPGVPPPNIRVITPDACTAVIIPQGPPGPASEAAAVSQQVFVVDEGALPALPLDGPAICIELRNNGNRRMYFTDGAA